MKKILLGVVLLVILSGGWFLLSNRPDDAADEAMKTANLDRSEEIIKRPESIKMEKEETTVAAKVMGSGESLVAPLEDVSGGAAKGTGYVLRERGVLYHYVSADLPPPLGGNKYEGWLVKREPSLLFFSTGVMTLSESGTYELSYESEDESIGYDFVVITEETVVDEVPEKHILEGVAR
jgi:hypothetical protein